MKAIIKHGLLIDTKIVSIDTPKTYYVDNIGIKHHISAGDRVNITCRWLDELVKTSDGWRVKTVSDEFAAKKQTNIDRLKATHDRLLLTILGNPTPAEMHTWPRQQEQAEAIMGGSPSQAVLDAVSRRMIEGETHQVWAAKVLLVKSPFAKYCEELATGVLRRANARLEALEYSENWLEALQTANEATAADAQQAQSAALTMLGQLKSAAAARAAGTA